jgi:uncharacterized membrane protein
MHGILLFLILAGIGCLICGPLALIISIIALKRIDSIKHRPLWQEENKPQIAVHPPPVSQAVPRQEEPKEQKLPKPPHQTAAESEPDKLSIKAIAKEIIQLPRETASDTSKQRFGLEQRIGTRWILIAGVIAVIFGAGFFLKYAYDNNLVGPLGRVIIVAAGGLLALVIGEVTRRREYGIVAKAVTALGFALLYTAVFSARVYYQLLSTTPAFVLSICVTAAAMLYALGVDEIVAAILSLVGGFLTPVIISTGENLPNQLFVYVLILGTGALLCACCRRWWLVDLLAFIGTFALYTGWFEKFYRPALSPAMGMPAQLPIALSWLAVFFGIYFVLPVFYQLLRKAKARKEEVLLIVANAAVVFYYSWTILYKQYRPSLAFCCLGLSMLHLMMMVIVTRRNNHDKDLRNALLIIGLSFLTVAIPLYLKMYAIAIAWAIEAVVLGAIGMRYRSIWTRLAGAVAMLLGLGQLIHRLPMHSETFTLVFNPAFGSWFFAAVMLVAGHLLYRTTKESTEEPREVLSNILYGTSILLLLVSTIMEWYCHCRYNLKDEMSLFYNGTAVILAVFPLLFLLKPVSPGGIICNFLAAATAEVGAIFLMFRFYEFYENSFVIFANPAFITVLLFVVSLFIAKVLLGRNNKDEKYISEFKLSFLITGIVSLWIFLTEEIYLYWYWQNQAQPKIINWIFLAHMYISVMWAIYGASLMIIGFWRKSSLLRYVSFGLFALLLIKVFIVDTSAVESVYRIGAFLATGITLVGVSYLYQFLKKKGFFDTILNQTNPARQKEDPGK